MKKQILIFTLIATTVASTSCSKIAINSENGVGTVTLNLEINERTKAAMSEDELLANSIINIYKGDFSALVRTYKYSRIPTTIYLPADAYSVEVLAGEISKETPAIASWEQKSYIGSSKFTVTAGTTQSVEVVANIVNAVSKVTFDASISENFNEGYTFDIGVDESDATQRLAYTADKSGNEGYFIVPDANPCLFWKFSGTLTKDGGPFQSSGKIENIEKGKLYKLAPKYIVHEGDLSFTLSVDRDTENFEDIIFYEPDSD